MADTAQQILANVSIYVTDTGTPAVTPGRVGDLMVGIAAGQGGIWQATDTLVPADWTNLVPDGSLAFWDKGNSSQTYNDSSGVTFGTGRDVIFTADGTNVIGTGSGDFYFGTVTAIPGAIQITSVGGTVTPGIMATMELAVAAGATGDVDFTLSSGTFTSVFIMDVLVIKTDANGGAGDTLQIQTGAGAAISDAISLNVNDTDIARASQINDANATIAAGGTLRVRRTQVTNCASRVYVHCMIRA